MKPPHSALPGDNRATWATAFEAAQLIKPPACGWCLTGLGLYWPKFSYLIAAAYLRTLGLFRQQSSGRDLLILLVPQKVDGPIIY